MRIGLIIYGSLNQLSGGYLYDKFLVDNLIKWGNEVEIISIPWKKYPTLINDNFSKELKNRLTNLDVDILIQDELNHPSLFLLNRIIKNKIDYPIISIVHHPRYKENHFFVFKYVYMLIEKIYFSTIDGFVYVSDSTRKNVENLIGKKTPSIIANPAGNRLQSSFSESDIINRARNNKLLKLLFVGSVTERKGLLLLIESLKMIPKSMWKLTIIGNNRSDLNYTKLIKKTILKYNLNENILFTGTLNDIKLIQQYQENDLLVMPSYIEGFGITYLEGMSFGLPAIGGNQGAAKELISHGINGFLVSPVNSEELTGHIIELIYDKKKLIKMSLAARKQFDKHITWDESAKLVFSFLRNIKNNYQIMGTKN